MLKMSPLSDKQTKVLETIRDFIEKYDYPPSIREIGDLVGISSTSVVSYNLKALQEKGYITRDPEVSRGLRLVEGDEPLDQESASPEFYGAEMVSVPLLGSIAAGKPIEVPDYAPESSEVVNISSDLLSTTDQIYALRVQGTSMIEDLINDGDLVILRHQETANNGDTVAAWLKDEKETTLKRYYYVDGQKNVRLEPANPLMKPIIVPASNVEIQGKLICVIRSLG